MPHKNTSLVQALVVPAILVAVVCQTACGPPEEAPEPTVPEATTAPVEPEPGPDGDGPRGLGLTTPNAAPGYVFFNPLLSHTTYLVDVEGRVVHTWESQYDSGGGAYLLDNSHLLRGGQEPDPAVFSGGGQAGRIQEVTWDGEVVWDFVFADEHHLLHHDLAVLPNGNVLAIAWEAKTAEEAVLGGRRPELTPEAGLWPDMIVEFEPKRPDGAQIVWEWHMWDHTIQDVDPALANYGDPAAHPERIDINGEQDTPQISAAELARLQALGYVPPDAAPEDLQSDLMHTNAIAYNPILDQIVLSVLRYNEIWIIDHSTTTTEAAGREGGRWGRGGDLLYRWGNPRTYGRGGEDDQRLFGQHDVRWVGEGTPGSGRLTLFNNRIPSPEGDHSAVFELAPPMDDAGRYVVRVRATGAIVELHGTGQGVVPQFLHFRGAPPPERPYVHHRGCNGALFRGDTRGRHRLAVPDALLRHADLQPGRTSQSIRSVSGHESFAGPSRACRPRPASRRTSAAPRAAT